MNVNVAYRNSPPSPRLATMKAAVLTGPGRVELQDVPMPVPGKGEVRVRLEGCGVCASNLGPWAGPEWMRFPTSPGDLGHEGWGHVDALGPDVVGLRQGDRVATLFYNSYAQYDVGPAGNVVVLPPALEGVPTPLEPLACAVGIFRRSGIAGGQRVAIVGAGTIGILLLQFAKAAGASVTVFSRRDTSLEFAARFGADHVVQTGGSGEETGMGAAGLFDCVIEATGKQAPLDLAAGMVRERGRLVIAGYHQDGPRTVNMQLWNWRGIDVVNAHERDPDICMAGMREAADLAATGRIDLRGLVTDVYPLQRLGDALDATRDRRDGFMKAIVEMA